MAKTYSVKDIFESEEFYCLKEKLNGGKFKPTAWAYVSKIGGNEPEILVAERYKRDDPSRKGQLVVPGGSLKRGESYLDAAKREALEETGVRTADIQPDVLIPLNNVIIKMREKVFSIVDIPAYPERESPAKFWVVYKDTGKMYACSLIGLNQMEGSEPTDRPESDARNPRFMDLSEACHDNYQEFTPAVQTLLEELEYTNFGSRRGENISVRRDAALYKFLRVGDPE